MKRFYKLVSLFETQGGYGVQLDGRPVKTPAGKVLICAHKQLAEDLMLEWASQQKDILPQTMPVNQIVITSLDGLASREEKIAHILDYTDTDLLFYRSAVSPYREAQDLKWRVWTDWFEKKYSVPLIVTTDISPLSQKPEVAEAVRSYIQNLDDLKLTLFEILVEATSSIVLSLAVFDKAATAEDVFQAVFLEDLVKAKIYDEEKYGAAPDQEKKRTRILSELKAAEKILACT